MKTLSRAITATFFDGTTKYAELQRHWSLLLRSERKHGLTAAHHLLYLAARGKDWRKAFTPITNPRKLKNGAYLGWELWRALAWIHSKGREQELLAPFDGLMTTATLAAVRALVPMTSPYGYTAEAFRVGSFPFDAYNTPEPSLHAAPATKESANG